MFYPHEFYVGEHESYVNRAKAAFEANYLDKLPLIDVPTLIITPSYDRLIGENAARQMLEGIPDAKEVVLERTGHMFHFSHPVTYAEAIENFIRERIENKEVKFEQ